MFNTKSTAHSLWHTEWTGTIARWSSHCAKSDLSETAVRVRVWRLGAWVNWAQHNRITPHSVVTPHLVSQFADAMWGEQRNRTHMTLAACRLFYDWLSHANNSSPGSLSAFAPSVIERYRILNRKRLRISILEDATGHPHVAAFLDQTNRCLPAPVAYSQFVLWLHLLSCGVFARELSWLTCDSLIRDPHSTYLQLPPGRLFIGDGSAVRAWDAHFAGARPTSSALTEVRPDAGIYDDETISEALAGVLAIYSTPRGSVALTSTPTSAAV